MFKDIVHLILFSKIEDSYFVVGCGLSLLLLVLLVAITEVPRVARLYKSRSIFNNFYCFGGRKFIPGGRSCKNFWKFLCKFVKIPRSSKKVLQIFFSKISFLAKKSQFFLKNDIFWGFILQKLWAPLNLRAAKKVWRAALWPCLYYSNETVRSCEGFITCAL